MARLVISEFRLSGGIAVLTDLGAYVVNDACARRQRGDGEHDARGC
jgi:hypothetical protein